MFFLFAVCAAGKASAEDIRVLTMSRERLAGGVALIVDGKPYFIKRDVPDGVMNLEITPPGAIKTISVAIQPDVPASADTFVLPVSIEDKALARGVTLVLTAPGGEEAKVVIPPRRVLFSYPINIPVNSAIHPAFGAAGRNLIVQVIPKITKKAQVNVDNTAADGVVATIHYENLADLKLKDLLNRDNRRDLDGTFFIGKDKDYHWGIITENLFEKFDKREISLSKNYKFGEVLRTEMRLGGLQNTHAIQFGMNANVKTDKLEMMTGNIDRRVNDRTHTIVSYGTEDAKAIVRMEGIEVKNPTYKGPIAIAGQRTGFQFTMNREWKNRYLSAELGTLKVRDLLDRGEIDRHFNSRIRYGAQFGQRNNFWTDSKFNWSGETDLEFYAVGSASWLRGELNFNFTFYKNYTVYVRMNNDFARITGRAPGGLWENQFLSLMRNRDFFDPKDALGRWGLESVYIDLNLSRTKKGAPFTRRSRFGFSRFIHAFRYDLPLEFYIETNFEGRLRPGAGISIRRYL